MPPYTQGSRLVVMIPPRVVPRSSEHVEGAIPCTASSWLMRNRLSVRSSFISTNCPDRILSTIFLGIGSAAGDKTSPGGDGEPNTVMPNWGPITRWDGNVSLVLVSANDTAVSWVGDEKTGPV